MEHNEDGKDVGLDVLLLDFECFCFLLLCVVVVVVVVVVEVVVVGVPARPEYLPTPCFPWPKSPPRNVFETTETFPCRRECDRGCSWQTQPNDSLTPGVPAQSCDVWLLWLMWLVVWLLLFWCERVGGYERNGVNVCVCAGV